MEMIKQSRQIFWGLIFVLLLSPALLFAELPKLNRSIYPDESLLLLNSGLTRSETSLVKYIIWTDDSSELPAIHEILQNSNCVWQKNIISDFTGNKIYKFTLENRVDKDQEKLILKQLDFIENQIKGKQIELYFQQQLDETLDIMQYSSSKLTNLLMVETENLASITGYSDAISKTVQSGNRHINVQIINSYQKDQGKTLLAIPALLDEF